MATNRFKLRKALKWGGFVFLAHLAATVLLVVTGSFRGVGGSGKFAYSLQRLIDWPVLGLAENLAARFPNVFYAMGGWLSGRSIDVALIDPQIVFLGLIGGVFYFLLAFALSFLFDWLRSRRTGGLSSGNNQEAAERH